MPIKTARMTLMPATAALARVEIENRPAFAALLRVGWLTWYGVADGAGGEPGHVRFEKKASDESHSLEGAPRREHPSEHLLRGRRRGEGDGAERDVQHYAV